MRWRRPAAAEMVCAESAFSRPSSDRSHPVAIAIQRSRGKVQLMAQRQPRRVALVHLANRPAAPLRRLKWNWLESGDQIGLMIAYRATEQIIGLQRDLDRVGAPNVSLRRGVAQGDGHVNSLGHEIFDLERGGAEGQGPICLTGKSDRG